jgi:peroxiredoxin Q/BCP
VAILGVSFDPVDANRAFAEKFAFQYPLISDTARELGVKYGAADDAASSHARRVAYLIGPDGKIKHVWPKADVKAFAQQVLDAV